MKDRELSMASYLEVRQQLFVCQTRTLDTLYKQVDDSCVHEQVNIFIIRFTSGVRVRIKRV